MVSQSSRQLQLQLPLQLPLQLVSCLLLLIAAAGPVAGGDEFGRWNSGGRATMYGTDAWSIHKGSCGYGWLDRAVATGWDVAAISDRAGDFSGSCGKCKEVKCQPMAFADGYGQWLDRKDACYDPSASVVVMITDQCPCHYPDNYASNKRWCCGDLYHLDLSVWAYEKLADSKWGVIGIQWRDVPCWHKPNNQAKVPKWNNKPTPQPWWEKQPSDWHKAMDRRINNRFQFQNGVKHNSGKH